LRKEPKALRANLLMRARSDLTSFLAEVLLLLFSKQRQQHGRIEFRMVIDAVAWRLQQWYANLPNDLQQYPDMPCALFEFQ